MRSFRYLENQVENEQRNEIFHNYLKQAEIANNATGNVITRHIAA